jgi:hypothetical protein
MTRPHVLDLDGPAPAGGAVTRAELDALRARLDTVEAGVRASLGTLLSLVPRVPSDAVPARLRSDARPYGEFFPDA